MVRKPQIRQKLLLYLPDGAFLNLLTRLYLLMVSTELT